MSEPINTPTAPSAPDGGINAPTGAEPTKMFTQAEVDQIVVDRLNRVKNKYLDYEELKAKALAYDTEKPAFDKAQTELSELRNANTLRELHEKVSAEHGVPAHLLTATTEEECVAQANAILAFARPSGYPAVPDGGSVLTGGGATTRDQFASWFNEIKK